jgi:hypothetical protein
LEAQMKDDGKPKMPIRERLVSEAREFAVIAAYLFVCFGAIAYLKAAILHAHGIVFAPFGFAAVKALICAKFVSLGHILHVGERFNEERYKTLPLIWPTLHKSFAFLVLLLVLNALEEVIVGIMHHRTVADSLAEFGGGTYDQLIATSFVGLLILIPFFAFRTLGEVVGEHNLICLFFEHRRRAASQ